MSQFFKIVRDKVREITWSEVDLAYSEFFWETFRNIGRKISIFQDILLASKAISCALHDTKKFLLMSLYLYRKISCGMLKNWHQFFFFAYYKVSGEKISLLYFGNFLRLRILCIVTKIPVKNFAIMLTKFSLTNISNS